MKIEVVFSSKWCTTMAWIHVYKDWPMILIYICTWKFIETSELERYILPKFSMHLYISFRFFFHFFLHLFHFYRLFCLNSENGEYEFLDLKTKISKYAPKGWKSDSNDVSLYLVLLCFTTGIDLQVVSFVWGDGRDALFLSRKNRASLPIPDEYIITYM